MSLQKTPPPNAWNALVRYPLGCGLRLADFRACSRSSVVTFAAFGLPELKVTLPAAPVAVGTMVSPANAVAGGVKGMVPAGVACRNLLASAVKAVMPVGW